MFHVLEHIKDPIECLKELATHLNKNGKIIIEIPNASDALLKLYNCKSFADFTYWSCHLFLYNNKTITDIVKKSGLKIKKRRNIQRYGLANHLHWILKNKPGGHKVWAKYNFRPINKFYAFILSILSLTDTIEIEVIKSK